MEVSAVTKSRKAKAMFAHPKNHLSPPRGSERFRRIRRLAPPPSEYPIPTRAARQGVLHAIHLTALVALVGIVFAMTQLLHHGVASADEGPSVSNVQFTPIDEHGNPIERASVGGLVRIDFLVAGVQRGAEVNVRVHWQGSGGTGSEHLGGISLSEESPLRAFFRIPVDASVDEGNLDLGIQIQGRYWPFSETSSPSWFSRTFGTQKAEVAVFVLPAAYLASIAWGQVALWGQCRALWGQCR